MKSNAPEALRYRETPYLCRWRQAVADRSVRSERSKVASFKQQAREKYSQDEKRRHAEDMNRINCIPDGFAGVVVGDHRLREAGHKSHTCMKHHA